jgi:hypothetical protein
MATLFNVIFFFFFWLNHLVVWCWDIYIMGMSGCTHPLTLCPRTENPVCDQDFAKTDEGNPERAADSILLAPARLGHNFPLSMQVICCQ